MASDFNVDLVNVSHWYDKHNLLRQLKVLYKDLIAVADIDKARKTIDLLHELMKFGHLSSENLMLLYETIKVTRTFGAIEVFQNVFLEVQEIEITQFSSYRLSIVDFGNKLGRADIDKIDELYNVPLKNYEDQWSMIMDLENRNILCEENIENFITSIRKIGLQSVAESLTKELPSCSRHIEEKDAKQETNSKKIEEYLLRTQKALCENAYTFTPEVMSARYNVDMSQLFTDIELLKESKKNQGGKPTTLDEVVDVLNSMPKCKALIDGEGGIGKTTILRYLSYNWATRQSIFEDKIVFLLCARDLDKGEDILDLIVKQLDMKDFNLDTDLPDDPRLIKKFIKKHESKIVLLVDGLDELRFNNQCVINLFRKKYLEKSTLILTSRSENIDEFIKACNVHIRVKGFNKESIGNYIDKYFVYFEKPQLGESFRKEFDIDTTRAGRKHSKAYSMSKNPMLLLAMCMLWEETQIIPDDNADLFKEIFRSILNQFNKQENIPKISKFEETPKKCLNAMILLGKCMYNSLKVNQLSIKKKDLNEGQMDKGMVDLALKLGFVYEEAPISKSNFEIFLMPHHKLIVESLVGFYLYKLCESEDIEMKYTTVTRKLFATLDDNEWEVIRESRYLRGTREFAIGFLGNNACAFLKHWITDHLSTYRFLPRNLKLVRKQHEINVVDALINYMTSKDLEINKHIDDISTSIRMLIDHISPGVNCDGHFIHLILQLFDMNYNGAKLFAMIEEFSKFCSRMVSDCNGRVVAHILGIEAKCKDVKIHGLSGKVMNQMIRECLRRQVQIVLEELDIRNNNLLNIDGTLLGSLLVMSPKLCRLYMHNCNLSGDVMNQMIRECLNSEVQLALEYLDISFNNLRNIDGTLLGSLLIMSPKLIDLDMGRCTLSGDIINQMIRECSSKRVQLEVKRFNISGNNLNNFFVPLLSPLLIMSPKLDTLSVVNCNLSDDIINHMGKECWIRGVGLVIIELSNRYNNKY